MARAGRDPRARRSTCSRASIRPGVTHRRARQARRALHPLAGRDADVQGLPRLSRLDLRLAERDDRARHPRALPRSRRGDIISIDVGVTLDGWVADAARTFAVEDDRRATRANLLDGTERVAARRRRAVPSPATAWATSPARSSSVAEDAGPVGRALARRPRRRAQHARGPAGPQLRQARQGAAAGGGHGARDRADDDRRRARRCAWAATAGRSSPRTARRRRTSSSRSRSPPTGRGS